MKFDVRVLLNNQHQDRRQDEIIERMSMMEECGTVDLVCTACVYAPMQTTRSSTPYYSVEEYSPVQYSKVVSSSSYLSCNLPDQLVCPIGSSALCRVPSIQLGLSSHLQSTR